MRPYLFLCELAPFRLCSFPPWFLASFPGLARFSGARSVHGHFVYYFFLTYLCQRTLHNVVDEPKNMKRTPSISPITGLDRNIVQFDVHMRWPLTVTLLSDR